MATRQYIGARYVPKFYENSNNTADWEAGVAYEPLTIVTYNGNSYTSKKAVPAATGNPSANPGYWVATGIFNTQLNNLNNAVTQLTSDVGDLQTAIRWHTPEMYGAVGDGVTDDTQAFQDMFDNMQPNDMALVTATVYLCDGPITITGHNLRISGGWCRAEYYPTIRTSLTSGTFITMNRYGNGVSNILFEGPALDANGVTLVDMTGDNNVSNGNVDAIFTGCGFFKAKIGITVEGRNVRCNDCIFSSLYIGYQAAQTVMDTDNRGYVITNNRFHYVFTCIYITVNNVRPQKNIIIIGNFADVVNTFFAGNGGGLVIMDNAIDTTGVTGGGTIIVVRGNNYASDDVLDIIKGNTITGRSASGYGILAEAGAKVMIIDNVIQYTGTSAVGGAGTSFVIVRGNYWNGIGGTYAAQFAATVTGIVKNNTISNTTNSTIAGTGVTIADNDVI